MLHLALQEPPDNQVQRQYYYHLMVNGLSYHQYHHDLVTSGLNKNRVEKSQQITVFQFTPVRKYFHILHSMIIKQSLPGSAKRDNTKNVT